MPLPRLALVLGAAGALGGGMACSGGKDGGQVAIVTDAGGGDGRDGGDGGDGGGADAVEAGLGASLSWYCPAPGATCPASAVSDYNRCLFDRCEAALASCPCEGWINCITRCGCADVACRAACVPTFDCLACGQAAALCVRGSGCERPICYDQLPVDAAAPDGPAREAGGGVVVVFPVPSPPLPDARPPVDAPATDGGLQGTCAELRRCCDSLASASARTTCQSQVTLLQTDPLCAAALLVYRSTAMCQ